MHGAERSAHEKPRCLLRVKCRDAYRRRFRATKFGAVNAARSALRPRGARFGLPTNYGGEARVPLQYAAGFRHRIDRATSGPCRATGAPPRGSQGAGWPRPHVSHVGAFSRWWANRANVSPDATCRQRRSMGPTRSPGLVQIAKKPATQSGFGTKRCPESTDDL